METQKIILKILMNLWYARKQKIAFLNVFWRRVVKKQRNPSLKKFWPVIAAKEMGQNQIIC